MAVSLLVDAKDSSSGEKFFALDRPELLAQGLKQWEEELSDHSDEYSYMRPRMENLGIPPPPTGFFRSNCSFKVS